MDCTQRGYTVLLKAAMSGDQAAVKLLLEAGADIEAKDYRVHSLLT
jgi:ankyrin repeat protein